MKNTILALTFLNSILFSNISIADNKINENITNKEIVLISLEYASFYHLQEVYCKKKAKKDDAYEELNNNYNKIYKKATKENQKKMDDIFSKVFENITEDYKDKAAPKSRRQCSDKYDKLIDVFKRLKK